ncbi:MAG: ATP-binding protein [Actinomycetota bacterium]
MNLLPVEMFDHIVITAVGKPWAVFAIRQPNGMASYRFHSDAAMVNYAAQIMGWVKGLPLEARLLSVAVPIDPAELTDAVAAAPQLIAEQADERPDERYLALEAQAIDAGDRLIDRPAHRRSHFLAVTLDDADTIRSSAAEMLSQVSQMTGRRRAPSSLARRRELLAAAELTAAGLGDLVQPATQDQVRWLMQRAVTRGLRDQPPTPASARTGGGRGVGSAGSRRATRRGGPTDNGPTSYPTRPLLDATLIEGGERRRGGLPRHRQMLRVQSADGESFQTTLVLASMPPEWSFPESGYWLAAADEFDFPVDVTVRIYSPPQHETKKQFRRRHKELASQPEQYSGMNTGVPDAVFDLIDRSNDAQSKLEGSRLNRIHRTLTCFTVAADSPEELQRRVATVRAELAASGYELHAPTGDQHDLFLLGLPGTAIRPGGVVADYDLDLTAEAIASGLPGFTPGLGDTCGAYLGHRLDVGPAMPVLLSPSVTTSASTMGFGASGGGKSFTAKTIALAELTGGAQVVAIDRTNRGEYVQFAEGLPGFLSSEVVDLSGETSISLCPMSTFPGTDRVEITSSFLCLLAGVGARTMESARIAQAVEYVDQHHGTTQDVLDVLRVWGDDGDGLSRDLFYRISPLARTRFARLAFQPGAGISVGGADLIVLHARGLVLPSKDEVRSGDDLDASKAASIAMVYLLMALADAIGNTPHRLSSIILDEAWAFLDSSFGLDLANRVLRDGRKDFKKLQLWSQHPADAPPDLLNMASNVFLTRQVEGAGATALRMVGAEPTPELITMVEQLAIGEMVMRDEYGRLGVIHVAPPVDPRAARAFDTRPRSGDNRFQAYEEPPPDPRPLEARPDPQLLEARPDPQLLEDPPNPRLLEDPAVPAAMAAPTRAELAEAVPPAEIAAPVPSASAGAAPQADVESGVESGEESAEVPIPPEPVDNPARNLRPHPVAARARLETDLFERLIADDDQRTVDRHTVERHTVERHTVERRPVDINTIAVPNRAQPEGRR